MDILISTNIYNTQQFKKVFKLTEMFKDYNVGVEVFPLWHDNEFEEVLKQFIPLLSNIPVSFHGPYYNTEHSAPLGTIDYDRSIEYFKKTLYYSEILNAKYLVYHHNNCTVDSTNKETMINTSTKNLLTCSRLADEYGIKILVENAGVIDRNNMLFDEKDFTSLCSGINNNVLIDIGHSHCNGWNLERLMNNLKDKINAYHLHNNYGKKDEHNRIFDGTLDFNLFLKDYTSLTPNADLVVEYSSLLSEDDNGIINDLQFLIKHFK